jgi:hypothetical protein
MSFGENGFVWGDKVVWLVAGTKGTRCRIFEVVEVVIGVAD